MSWERAAILRPGQAPRPRNFQGHVVASPRVLDAAQSQQAGNVTGDIEDARVEVRFLVRDPDTKYVAGFDGVFRSKGARILKTSFRTQKPTPMPKDLCAPSGPSIWITFSSSTVDTLNGYSAAMQSTTTATVHIGASPRRSRHRCRPIPCRQQCSRPSTSGASIDTTDSEG